MKEQKIGIGSNSKDRIETKQLKIARNIFAYNDTFIPLSNISRVAVVKEKEQQYPMQAIITLIIGVVMFLMGDFITVIGIIAVMVGAWILYKTYKFNQEIGEYLAIELNSGSKLYFYEKNHQFLLEVMEVMTNCINNNSDKIYTVSMDTYNIEACQFGAGNYMMTAIRGK